MGLIANQMAVEMLCKMAEKLKKPASGMKADQIGKTETKKERDKNHESSKRTCF